VREQIFLNLDNWLFHLHSFIQGSEMQIDAKERIMTNGRVFQEQIDTIEDMKQLSIDQLQYIAGQHISRHRIYSLAQGGISGTGGALLIGADIPGMAVINLRAVQLIAMTYGIEVNTPYEVMTALKVFNASIHPMRYQSAGWEDLTNDFSQENNRYFYEGNEELANITWIDADFICTAFNGYKSELIIEMNINHKGNVNSLFDFGNGVRGTFIWTGHSNKLTTSFFQSINLSNGCFNIMCLRRCHTLNK